MEKFLQNSKLAMLLAVTLLLCASSKSNAQCAVTANFSYSIGYNGLVTFNNTSSGATNYYWNFGNGNTAYQTNSTSTYMANGTYYVTLFAVDSINNCSDTATRAVIITNTSSCAGSFYFDANNVYDANFYFYAYTNSTSAGVIYNWDFGDGTTLSGTQNNTQHTYLALGNYPVTLLIIDTTTNCRDTITHTVTVNCTLSAAMHYTVDSLGTYHFNSSSLGTNANTQYTWSIENYIGSTATYTLHTNYFDTISQTFNYNGVYSVWFAIYDSITNCQDTIRTSIIVKNKQCAHVDFSTYIWPSGAGAPGYAQFNPTYTYPSYSYHAQTNWTYGDGAIGTGNSAGIAHQYNNNGTYMVTMLIHDTIVGCTDTVSHFVTITSVDSCNASFNSYDTTLGTVHKVAFYQTSSGVTMHTHFIWNFGDGTTGTGAYIEHTYTSNGTYYVTLYMKDSTTNCFSQYIDSVVVTNASPTSIKNTTTTALLTIYPNPNNGTFSIATKANATYSIVNELGQTIQSFTTTNNVATVSGLTSGMYFLIGTNGNQLIHQKIVVTQ